MPYERIEIEGIGRATVRTGEFWSSCQKDKRLQFPTVDEWTLLARELLNPTGGDAHVEHIRYLKHAPTNSVSVVRCSVGGNSWLLVCKQSRRQGLFAITKGLFTGSHEKKQFETAQKLLTSEVRTAVPVALVERSGLKSEAILITEFIEELADLDTICLKELGRLTGTHRREVKSAIIDETIILFSAFWAKGIFHRDLKASNVLVFGTLATPKSIRVGLVDLEGVRTFGGRSSSRWQRAMVRLAASLRGYESVTKTDFLRFFQRYFGDELCADGWKPLFRKLSHDVENYASKSRARKGNKLDGYQ